MRGGAGGSHGRCPRLRGTAPGAPDKGEASTAFDTLYTDAEPQNVDRMTFDAQEFDATITRLDGVSVDYDDWHFNVRPSNTEPLLRLNLESLVSREDMESKRDEILGLIRG